MYDLLNSPKFRNFDQRLNTPHIMSPSRFTPAALPTGGWVELGRTTLGSALDNIDVVGFANKRYYMILCSDLPTGDTQWTNPVGNTTFDTGTNYSSSEGYNGAADGVVTSNTNMRWNTGITTTAYTLPKFGVGYISNLATKEKLAIFHGIAQQGTGAGTAPNRAEEVSKWTNTAAVIDRFRLNNIHTGSFNTGSEVVVLGWDPADVHTTNFWTELASVTAGGASTNLSSGTITGKKYLWVQTYTESNSAHVSNMIFNNDTTTYAYRNSDDGGADATATSDAHIEINQSTSTGVFTNMFIINISAKEKLVIGSSVLQGTAGAAAAPSRREFVGKYDSTAAQITEIDIDSSSGNYTTKSTIKVWGSD